MPILNVPVLLEESGVFHHPASVLPVNTHDSNLNFKEAVEVFAFWNGSAWATSDTFVAGSQVVLQVTNLTDGVLGLVDYPLNDWNAGRCCVIPTIIR